MAEQSSHPAAQARLAKILKFMGLFDILLGIVAFLFGPVWVPGIEMAWWIVGGAMAAAGLGLIFYGRAVQKRLDADNRTVVR